MSTGLLARVTDAVQGNGGKLPFQLILDLVVEGTVTYTKLTPNMRVCVITLDSGHEVIGIAQVLNAENDVEAIGNKVAYDRAIDELWPVLGTIAKLI